MKEINYWQQFMSTGSVKDYLSYRMENSSADSATSFSDSNVSGTAIDLGENSYAGVCCSNRNNFENGACR